MTIRRLSTALAILTPMLALPVVAQEASLDTLAIGQRATMFFYDGEMDSLWTMFTPSYQEKLGSIEQLFERFDFLSERAGDEVAVYLGGGFGRRAFVDMATEAATIAKRAGAPVKLVWSREDDMARDYYRPTSLHRLRGAIETRSDEPVSVIAWEHRLAMPSIMPDARLHREAQRQTAAGRGRSLPAGAKFAFRGRYPGDIV